MTVRPPDHQRPGSFAYIFGELLLLGILASILFVAVVAAVQELFGDEKVQYLVVGYYAAVHTDLVRWLWRCLRVERDPPACPATPRGKSSTRS